MIPNDVYQQDVDFTSLALQFPDFAQRLKPNGQLDFSDPESVRQLTKALLWRDFKLKIELPEDRLCPPVPNRFNYIKFVQELVGGTRADFDKHDNEDNKVLALDIGTGASAIYPMLACRQRSNWYFLTTEIDSQSRHYAQSNIKTNGLGSNIRVVDTDQTGNTILPSAAFEGFDNFTIKIMMTNPPFYASEAEMLASAKQKARPPNSACTGAPIEMITEGGEVNFVSRIIKESMLPRNRRKIQWFSSMLGKFSSVSTIIQRLKSVECTNYAVTEFVQGQKTRRWCIAWSWHGLRPPSTVARGIPSLEKKLLPFPSEYDFPILNSSITRVNQQLHEELNKLDLKWKPSTNESGGIGYSTTGDVWSRKARRKRVTPTDHEMKDIDSENITKPSDSSDDDDDESEPAIIFKISISTITPSSLSSLPISSTTTTQPIPTIKIRWLQGQDSVIFESFCGWLKRKIKT